MTASWWETIDTGEGYTRADELAAWSLRPVQRGLVGQFEARSVSAADLAEQPTLVDLSGNGNHLVCADAKPMLFHAAAPKEWRPGAGTYGEGIYRAPLPQIDRKQVSVCGAWSVSLYHNSTVPASWGWSAQDYFFGLRYGLPSRFVPQGPMPGYGAGNEVDTLNGAVGPVVPLGLMHAAAATVRYYDQSELWIDGGQGYRAPSDFWNRIAQVFGHPGHAAVTFDGIECCRGNPFSSYRAMLYYDVELTQAEVLQNLAYVRAITGLS